jgi:hypothetical protein
VQNVENPLVVVLPAHVGDAVKQVEEDGVELEVVFGYGVSERVEVVAVALEVVHETWELRHTVSQPRNEIVLEFNLKCMPGNIYTKRGFSAICWNNGLVVSDFNKVQWWVK